MIIGTVIARRSSRRRRLLGAATSASRHHRDVPEGATLAPAEPRDRDDDKMESEVEEELESRDLGPRSSRAEAPRRAAGGDHRQPS
jgi:hypothetical protein